MTDLPPFHLSARARRDLGVAEVEDILTSLAASAFGKEHLGREPFPDTRAGLTERLDESVEAMAAVQRKVAPDFGALRDLRAILSAVEKGTVLGPVEILDVAKTMDGLARIHDVVGFQEEEAPILAGVAKQIDDDRKFVKRVLRSFDEQGQLADDASPELMQLRSKVRALRAEAQEKLGALIAEFDTDGLLRDRNFTLRNDRYVLPVRSEFQARVEGIVHDASQTGQTVFIEPRAMLQLGNRIKIARSEVIEEEQRILREMTEEIGEHAPALLADLERAGRIEAAFARGTFAAKIRGTRPSLSPSSELNLKDARHPLLSWMRALEAERGGRVGLVVGNDLGFGGRRALVITGPNAGGKTVALKTAGLLSVMARMGLPVSAQEGTSVPAFAAVLSAIGDEQSLDHALSSFSGHLVALKEILDDAAQALPTGPVLILLDELLAGTDPTQGASLAQALLEHLVERGAYVVATTHYERLKALPLVDAEHGAKFRNASVALEPGTGRPTFVLHLDQVGTSNAMDAARRFGLPDPIVARAEELLSPDERGLQQMLSSLSEQRTALAHRVEAAEAERQRFEDESRRLERRLADVEKEGQRLRKEGARAFLDELKEARRIVADAIKLAQEGADPRALNRLSHDLQKEEERAKALAEGGGLHARKSDLLKPSSVKTGDTVELSSMPGARMSVIEVNGDEVVVARGAMKMRATIDQLRTPDADEPVPKKGRDRAPSSTLSVGTEPKTSDNTIDVRGQRAEEAMELVEAFLDRLLRQGRSRAFIIHGHGSGALKKSLRSALSSSRYVRKATAAEHDDGGDGTTVVMLADDARV